MADPKKEIPPHVKAMEKVNSKFDMADLISDTTEVDMGKDFHESLDEIRDKNGRINYKLFDPEKHGDKYHHLVIDKYIGKLKKRITDKAGKDNKFADEELNLMMEGMYGTTKKMYMDTLAQLGSKFRIGEYKANLGKFIENLKGKLYNQAGDHLKTDDHVAIMKELTRNNPGVIRSKDMSEFASPVFRSDITSLIRSFYNSDGKLTRDQVKNTERMATYAGKELKIGYAHEKAA